MPTIENLDIQITASASDAASKIGRLASALSGVRGPSNSAKSGLRATKDETVQIGSKFQKLSNDVISANKSLVNFSKEVQNAGKAAKRGESGVSKFISSIKRIVLYRAIRSIIREISDAFREGTTNVYEWSKTVGGEFASNVDTLKSSIDLLKNSLGTLAVPLLNSLAPALNAIIDKLVDMINAFNMALAALNGQSTYTVAVRGASSTSNALTQMAEDAQNAEKAIKETVLGFDEINKLSSESTGGGSGGSGGGSGSETTGFHFEERPLEGFWAKVSDITSKMPDWLKWLLTGTALVGGFALIKSFIPWLIDKIKDLFSLTIPDFLKWLFGGDGDDGGDIDKDVKIDLEKGDWSALDGLSPQKVELDPSWSGSASEMFKDFKGDWDDLGSKSLYFVPKMNNSAKVLYDDFMKDWDALGSKSLYFSPKVNNSAKVLYDDFMRDWDALGSKSLYFSPKLDNTAKSLYDGFKRDWDAINSKSLYFSPKLDNTAKALYDGFKRDWDALDSKSLYFSPKMDNTAKVLYDGFKGDWDGLSSKSLYFSPKMDNTASVLYNGFKRDWDTLQSKSLFFSPKLDNTAKVLFDGFKKAWEEASSPLKVDVEVNWDGSGSGSGSGGGTSGGGNGRYTMPVTLETPTQTEVQTYWDALKKHWDNLSRLGIAVLGLSFSGVDAEGVATIWDLLKQSWDSGVVATGKYLEMVVQPISTAGQTLAEGASNFWNWLFGNDITTQGPTLDLEFEANAVLSPEVQLDQWQHKMDEWAEELGIDVPVTATVTTKASTLAYNFQQSWIKLTSGSKTVSFINQLRNAASGLAYAFQQSWIKLGNPNKQVSFINQLKSGASTLAYNFQQAWIKLTDNSKKVSFINQLKVAASSLAYGFQQGWIKLGDGAKQVSFLNVLRSGASALANTFQQNWIGLTDDSKKVSFFNQLKNAASGLAYGFLQNWIGLDDSKKKISFLNQLKTSAGTAASNFVTAWKAMDDADRKVYLINSLTRTGSNWSGKSGLTNWWNTNRDNAGGKGGVSLLTNLTNSGSNWEKGLLTFLTGNKDGIVSILLNIGGSVWDKVKSALGWLGVPGFANGGIITPFGISDFANGGILGHGTLFRAGENGAEVVGHIGGRTEVLNRSQLASTMYYSVRSAMAPLYTYGNSDESMTALAEYIGNAIDSAMAKDRELMRQQNEYLRQINDKEFSAEITTSSINQAQTRMNRRAGTTIVPVGT